MSTIYAPGTPGPWSADDDNVIVDNVIATVDGLGGGGTVTLSHPNQRQLAPLQLKGRSIFPAERTKEDTL